MHAIPYPQPKTSGGRPPFDPPRKTTFDSSPGEGGEPVYRLLTDSVNNVLKHLADSEDERLPTMLTLVRQRQALVNSELRLERMFMPDTLPPLIKNVYSLDYLFEESEVIRLYCRLLEQLSDAEQTILAKMEDLNMEPPASDL